MELVGEPLGHPQRHQLDAGSVIASLKIRNRLVAEFAGLRIRDEALGTVADFRSDMSAPVAARLLGNDEEYYARIARGVARLSRLADLPLATDCQAHVLDRAATEIGKRHDDDLAA